MNVTRIQSSLISNRSLWLQLCSSMDTAEDTQAAIQAFTDTVRTPDVGGRYLALYGVLQALFVQQDAIRDMHGALQHSFKPADDPRLAAIRDARNCSIGHPTKQGSSSKPSHHFIIQISMTAFSFDLLSHGPSGNTLVKPMNITTFIADQQEVLREALAKLLDSLIAKDDEHRRAHMSDTLTSALGDQIHYAFEKLIGGTRGWSHSHLGQWSIEHIRARLTEFENRLHTRGLSRATYPGVQLVLDDIDYPLTELEHFFGVKDTKDLLDPQAAYVFARYLQSEFDSLATMANEIDTEYKAGKDV